MFMASVDDSGQVNVMDVRTGAPFKRFRRKHDNLATCVAFRPHKPWELFTGSFDQSVIAWDFSRGSPNRDFTPALNAEVKSLNPPFVYCLQVSSDGKTCFIGKGDGTLQVLQSKGKKCKKEDWFVTDHEAHRWSLTSLSIDDQGLIATGSLDGGLGLWKLEENGQVKSRQKIEMGNYKVNALQRISNSAHQIAVAGYDATGQSTGDILIYSFQQ